MMSCAEKGNKPVILPCLQDIQSSKLYPILTIPRDTDLSRVRELVRTCIRLGERNMVALAATMFVALFGFGADYFHWDDPHGRVQLALFTSFILGIICGYKTKS